MGSRNDESKGRFEGQIGRVKASQYAFADGETNPGALGNTAKVADSAQLN